MTYPWGDGDVLTHTDLNAEIKKVHVCTSGTRPSHAAGLVIYETDTKFTLESDGTNWLRLGGLPVGRTAKSTSQAISSGAITVVTMSGLFAGISTGDFALSGNALQVLRTGWYLVGYQIFMGGGSDGGQRWSSLFKNSETSALVSAETALMSGSTDGCAQSASGIVSLTANDTLTLKALQSSGASLDVLGPASTNASGTYIWAVGIQGILS